MQKQQRAGRRAMPWVALGGLILALSCCGGNHENNTRTVFGATQQVSGNPVYTFGTLDQQEGVLEVGASVPLPVFQAPPAAAGAGPAGAIAVIRFPPEIYSATVFDHFELHWEPAGHPPAGTFDVPHFDFHFYGITEQEVAAIQPPDTAVPAANRVPAGYTYPGVGECVPQMGVHASPDLLPNPFEKVMILGYFGGKMTFIEPMVTQAYLVARNNFALDVPRPQVLGRATNYPTQFRATYNAGTNAYDFVFSNFEFQAQ